MYNIGQIKYNDLTFPDDVYTPIPVSAKGEYEVSNVEGYKVQKLVYKGLSLQRNVAYFVRIYIKRQRALEQSVTVTLSNDGGSISQKCKVLYIDALPADVENDDNASLFDTRQWTCCNFIFIPNQSGYSQLRFELSELLAINNKKVVGNISMFNQIVNLLNTKVRQKHGVNTIIKLGVQSRPGTVMCINGEEIRIGRTGFYEINSGVEINYFGFGAELKDFIFDYVYDMEASIKEGGA